MRGDGGRQVIEGQARDSRLRMFPRTDEQSRVDLLVHAHREIGRRGVVHGHNHHAAQRTSQKNRDPFGGIRPPENNAFAFVDSARFQFPRESK